MACIWKQELCGYDNWRVVDLVTTNATSSEEDNFYEIILRGIETRMSERILIAIFGTIRANDEATQGYYVVELLIKPYTVQENIVMKGVDPSHTFFAGEIICDAVFFDPVHNAIDWYIPMIKNDCFVMIRLK